MNSFLPSRASSFPAIRLCQGVLGVILGLLVACGPQPTMDSPPPMEAWKAIASAPKVSEVPKPVVARPTQERSALGVRTFSRQGVTLTVVSFDGRDHRLRILDQKSGPGSQWQSSQEAAQAAGGVAGINGGFFTPEGAPLGLVSAGGERRGGMNSSSLGAGFYLAGRDGTPSRLVSRGDFQNWQGVSGDFLQTGPRLIWDGRVVAGLSDDSVRPRSFLLWDGKNQWALGHADGASLAGLAKILADEKDLAVTRYALNLDGGRSSDLWVGSSVPGGELTRRSFLNKPVRNFLILQPKS